MPRILSNKKILTTPLTEVGERRAEAFVETNALLTQAALDNYIDNVASTAQLLALFKLYIKSQLRIDDFG